MASSPLSRRATSSGFQVAAISDTGLVRSENEDALAIGADGRVVAVADGMGGHARGAWASATICRALEQLTVPDDLHTACEAIADALADTNDMICAEGARGGAVIGSTVVALVLDTDRFACLWAGDSRAYLVRGGAIRQITRDHSQVEELVTAGLLTREQARDHPLGNVVTRAIGTTPGLALDVVEDDVRAGDRLLLCSDGLTKVMTDEEIAAVVCEAEPEAAGERLVRTVLDRGAPDNVTIIVVAVQEG